MTASLAIEGQTVGYGGAPVLEKFDLVVAPRSCVAVTGPNGAGKSTLIRAAMGQLKATAGRILIGGRDASRMAHEARARLCLALVPEETRL